MRSKRLREGGCAVAAALPAHLSALLQIMRAAAEVAAVLPWRLTSAEGQPAA